MITFSLVALGHLLGRRAMTVLKRRGAGSRTQTLALLGALTAGTAAGIALWRATAADGVISLFMDLSDALHQTLGALGDGLVASLFVLMMLGIVYGICISAVVVIQLLGTALALGLRRGEPSVEEPGGVEAFAESAEHEIWEDATADYGQAVAAAIHARHPGMIRVAVCGTAPFHLHVVGEDIVAAWDIVEGWSARTLRGRHWYTAALVPPPEDIAEWLRAVGNRPALGSGWPREWYSSGEVDAVLQARRDILVRLASVASSHRRYTELPTPVDAELTTLRR